MTNHRPAKSKVEVDLLPPFGEPTVSIKGERAAKIAATGVAVGAVISALNQ